MSGKSPSRSGKLVQSVFPLPFFLLFTLVLGSCSGKILQVSRVEREDLFTLSIGKLEDQLDLFQLPGSAASSKTRIFMRDGIFFISNGNSKKIVEFTSYGDLLSMIYNPEGNPPPIVLKPAVEGDSIASRKAFSYPFRSIGEIVVSSNLDIFVEDKLPPERKVVEESTGSLLDEVILRFSRSGEYKDYLGQEGIGGTPFPYILGLWCTKKDEIVVLSMTQDSWQVFWFDKAGGLVSALKVKRNSLPLPQGEKLIPSLEKIVPDMDSRTLYMKIDYYREAIDPATKTHGGIEFASSYLYSMNPEDGSIEGKIDIPTVEKREENSFGSSSFERVYEFLGAATGKNLFFLMPDEADAYSVMILNLGTKTMKKLSISVNKEEMFYNAFNLSSDGILSALFASRYDAKIVWWRTEKLIGETR